MNILFISISKGQQLRSLASFAIILLLTALILAGTPQEGLAGRVSSCNESEIFQGAAVNTVVLPYTSVDKRQSEAGKRLSLLIQLDSLFSLIKYQSVGAVYLAGYECDSKKIFKELSDKLNPGNGLVVIWGRIYEERDDIYVQSFLKFVRGERKETIVLQVAQLGNDDKSMKFTGNLPSQTITFAPRRLTNDDLTRIEQEFLKSVLVREKPSESAPGVPMFKDFNEIKGRPFSYTVHEVSGDWMKIVSIDGRIKGWIQGGSNWGLREKLPELSFMEGTAGYLRYRVAKEKGSDIAKWSLVEGSRNAFRQYEEASKERFAKMPMAVGKVVQGAMVTMEERDIDTANSFFKEAAKLVPYNANARNLEVISTINLSSQGGTIDNPELLEKRLLKAVALSPENAGVLTNLEGFYKLLSKSPDTIFSSEKLSNKIEAVQKVRMSLENKKRVISPQQTIPLDRLNFENSPVQRR